MDFLNQNQIYSKTYKNLSIKGNLKKVLSGELALMACLLAVALFNTFNAGTIVDGGPPPPFWVVLIVNPLLCIYGLVNNKN